MKNRTILFFTVIVVCCINLKGQPHTHRAKTMQFDYLKTVNGMGVQADISVTDRLGNMSRVSASFDIGEIGKATTSYKVAKVDYAYISTILMNDNENMFLNFGWGAFVSYESLENKILEMNKTNIAPGLNVLMEYEVFVYQVGFSLFVEQRYRPTSLIGDWEIRAGIGVKFLF